MDGQYEIVPYSPHHKQQVLELQQHLWGADLDANRAYFEWKYEQNPYATEPLVYLALHEGTVVGMRGACGAKWEAGAPAQCHMIPYVDDLVIAPAHRDRGLHTRIMQLAFADLARRGCQYVISLGGGHVTVLGSLTMGWKSVASMAPVAWSSPHVTRLHRVRDFIGRQRLLWRYGKSAIFLAACERQPFVHFDRSVATARGRRRGAVSGGSEPRAQEMAELVARLPYDGRIRHVRDAEYFTWRLRNPRHEHRLLYWDDQRLDGYMILQRHIFAPTCRVNLMDWEAGTEVARTGLLQASMKLGRFAELATWTATLPDPATRALSAAGFEPTDRALRDRGLPTALVRALDANVVGNWMLENRRVTDSANWDLRMLYQD